MRADLLPGAKPSKGKLEKKKEIEAREGGRERERKDSHASHIHMSSYLFTVIFTQSLYQLLL